MSEKKLPIQDLYDALRYQLAELKAGVHSLEKGYYSLSPRFDALEERIDAVLETLRVNGSPPFARKLANLKELIIRLRAQRGYESAVFDEIFTFLALLEERASIDIITPKLKTDYRRKIKDQVYREAEEKILRKKERRKKAVRLLMVRSGNMRFMLHFKKQLLRQQTGKNDRVKVTLKRHSERPVICRRLPGHDTVDTEPLHYTVIVIEKHDRTVEGFICDSIEGTMLLDAALYRRKVEYLKINDSRFEPYLKYKGERYFLYNHSAKVEK